MGGHKGMENQNIEIWHWADKWPSNAVQGDSRKRATQREPSTFQMVRLPLSRLRQCLAFHKAGTDYVLPTAIMEKGGGGGRWEQSILQGVYLSLVWSDIRISASAVALSRPWKVNQPSSEDTLPPGRATHDSQDRKMWQSWSLCDKELLPHQGLDPMTPPDGVVVLGLSHPIFNLSHSTVKWLSL
jgi:hypothetical protein